jgi:hypothetical protein
MIIINRATATKISTSVKARRRRPTGQGAGGMAGKKWDPWDPWDEWGRGTFTGWVTLALPAKPSDLCSSVFIWGFNG